MPGFNIRIAPPEVVAPEAFPRPVTNSRRWNSPYDASGLQPVVSVYITRAAYIRINVHAYTSDVEVGGILVGKWCLDEETGDQYVVVRHVLPARHTRQGSVYLTFTKDTLIDVHEQIDNRYQGERIVGWFHTHPRMGVFLSHYDTFLHGNFFPEPWQVALVVEPFSSVAGFFIRQEGGVLDPTRYFGFHELDSSGEPSIVRWQNLQKVEQKIEKVENEPEGGTSHE